MKTEIVKTEQTVNEIDWSKPQLVKSKLSPLIVWTDGNHSEESFSGKVLIEDHEDSVGDEYKSFHKSSFTPITEPITIKFIP